MKENEIQNLTREQYEILKKSIESLEMKKLKSSLYDMAFIWKRNTDWKLSSIEKSSDFETIADNLISVYTDLYHIIQHITLCRKVYDLHLAFYALNPEEKEV